MFNLVHAGTELQVITQRGIFFETVTLPSGVTLSDVIRARIATLAQLVVITNAPSENLFLYPGDFSCFKLGITAPATKSTLSSGGAGGLTGDYKVRYSFIHKIAGTVVNESPLSPESDPITLASNTLTASIAVSTDSQVTGRRLYRTTSGGAEFLFWIDVDDNSSTSVTDDTPDLELGDLVDSDRGPAPAGTGDGSKLTLLTAWKDRLWARSDVAADVDKIWYTEADQIYGWSPFKFFPAQPKGEDATGITGFLPRRDALGVGKRNRLLKITGSSEDDFAVLIVAENIGVVAPDSIVIIRDAAYFLASDGVYKWDDSGVTRISDAVAPWFTTDNVFDRTTFPDAYASYNPYTNCYELHFSDGTWVAVDTEQGEWFGPHTTAAFTPSAAALMKDTNAVFQPLIGATDGFLYKQNQTGGQDTAGSGSSVDIDANALFAWLTQNDPDMTHYWGRLSAFTRIESGSETLSITPTVGRINSTPQAAISFDLTLGRQITRRLGVGALANLRVQGRLFLLYGIDITPIGAVGRR